MTLKQMKYADAVATYLWERYEAVREPLLVDRMATNPAGTLPATK